MIKSENHKKHFRTARNYMRNNFFLIFLSITLICCSKSEESETIRASVNSFEVWRFHFEGFSIENKFVISDAPENALISEIRGDGTELGNSYFYQSEQGFRGIEKIIIEKSSSAGDDNFFKVKTYHIELTVE